MAKPYKSYAEKLLDPRWQRKRLEIMQGRDFTCEHCGSKEKTLHVHHGCYLKGHEPWEYPSEWLHCLCVDCHEYAQQLLRAIGSEMASLSIPQLEGLWKAVQQYTFDIDMEGTDAT